MFWKITAQIFVTGPQQSELLSPTPTCHIYSSSGSGRPAVPLGLYSDVVDSTVASQSVGPGSKSGADSGLSVWVSAGIGSSIPRDLQQVKSVWKMNVCQCSVLSRLWMSLGMRQDRLCDYSSSFSLRVYRIHGSEDRVRLLVLLGSANHFGVFFVLSV